MKLIIVRGIPGSGKSTWAHSQVGATVCSADDYFYVDGVYTFDPQSLPYAHNACIIYCKAAMQRQEPLIIVDNTNTQRWEYAPYLEIAGRYGYQVFQKVCSGTWQSTHGVPAYVIDRMRALFESDETFLHYTE